MIVFGVGGFRACLIRIWCDSGLTDFGFVNAGLTGLGGGCLHFAGGLGLTFLWVGAIRSFHVFVYFHFGFRR